jgi:hypothetical protein
MQCREYLMKYPGLLVLKLHLGGDLLLASSKILSHGIFKSISLLLPHTKWGLYSYTIYHLTLMVHDKLLCFLSNMVAYPRFAGWILTV